MSRYYGSVIVGAAFSIFRVTEVEEVGLEDHGSILDVRWTAPRLENFLLPFLLLALFVDRNELISSKEGVFQASHGLFKAVEYRFHANHTNLLRILRGKFRRFNFAEKRLCTASHEYFNQSRLDLAVKTRNVLLDETQLFLDVDQDVLRQLAKDRIENKPTAPLGKKQLPGAPFVHVCARVKLDFGGGSLVVGFLCLANEMV